MRPTTSRADDRGKPRVDRPTSASIASRSTTSLRPRGLEGFASTPNLTPRGIAVTNVRNGLVVSLEEDCRQLRAQVSAYSERTFALEALLTDAMTKLEQAESQGALALAERRFADAASEAAQQTSALRERLVASEARVQVLSDELEQTRAQQVAFALRVGAAEAGLSSAALEARDAAVKAEAKADEERSLRGAAEEAAARARLAVEEAARDAARARAEATAARAAELEARDAAVLALESLERAREAALAAAAAEPSTVLVPRQTFCAACPPFRVVTPTKGERATSDGAHTGAGGGSGLMAARQAHRAELAKLQLAHADELASAVADKAAADRRANAATARAIKLSNELAELKKPPAAPPNLTANFRPASASTSRRGSALPDSARRSLGAMGPADLAALRTEASVRDLERRLADMSKAREESQAARAAAERDVLTYKHALALAEEQIKGENPEVWRQGVVPTSKRDFPAEQLLRMARMQVEIDQLTAELTRAATGGPTSVAPSESHIAASDAPSAGAGDADDADDAADRRRIGGQV